MADYEDEEKEEFKIEEPNEFDFADEYGESVTCIIQRLLCNQKSPTYAVTSNI